MSAFVDAGTSFASNRGNRMAAAVSYRTIFALAPLLVIAVAIFGFVLGGSEQARAEVVQAIENIAGPQVASAVNTLILSAGAASGVTAIVGFALFFWTSSTLFFEVQTCLNDIFGVSPEETAGFAGFARKRVIGFLWALGLGLLMVGVWFLNAAWEWLAGLFPDNLSVLREIMGWVAPVISLVVVPLVFALSFRTMTSAPISFKAEWRGGLFTAAVFLLTAVGARVYFSWNADTSASQVAAGFFVLLLLAYMLSAAFLFGAHMTKVFDDRLQSRSS